MWTSHPRSEEINLATLKGKAVKMSAKIFMERGLLRWGSWHSLSVTEGVRSYPTLIFIPSVAHAPPPLDSTKGRL